MHLFQGFLIVATVLLTVNAGGSFTENKPEKCQYPDCMNEF